MNRRLALTAAIAAVFSFAGTAYAQQAEVTIGYQGLPYKASGESPTGIQVSEGVLAHIGAGAEAGYDTNVFYEQNNARGSAIIRTGLFGELANATRTGSTGKVAFSLRGGFTYRRYQSDDPAVQQFQNAWMPAAGLALTTGSGVFGFGLADSFIRLEDPPYNANRPPITRYNNQASLEGRWSPGGGRLTGTLRYTNMIDVFEGDYSFATSMLNQIMLDGSWKWLPKTAIFVNATQGFITYLEADTPKVSSYPLRIAAGLRGLLTEKTTAVFSLGYVNGFYSNGATTGGWLGSSYADLAFTVRPTMLSRVVLGFRHSFENSVISNFYYAETAYASYVQQLGGRLAVDISGRYVYRNYQGLLDPTIVERQDNFGQVGATLDYFLRNWMYAGVGYSLLLNDGNQTANPLNPPGTPLPEIDYVKQQVFVRLGLTY